jgi:hypothetical protein
MKAAVDILNKTLEGVVANIIIHHKGLIERPYHLLLHTVKETITCTQRTLSTESSTIAETIRSNSAFGKRYGFEASPSSFTNCINTCNARI